MSENSPRPNTRAQDQNLPPRGAHGIQQLFADSPIGATLSPYRLAKLRAHRLRFDDDAKSPAAERSKENVVDVAPCTLSTDASDYGSHDIPHLVQRLAEKQKVIESMQAALADMEQQTTRLRSLRRVVNSPAGLSESGRKDRTRKPKDKLMEPEGEGTPRTPLAEMVVDSPALPVAPSYINDLVSQIEALQLEKMELSRTVIPASSGRSPSKGKRKEPESAKKQLKAASEEIKSLRMRLDASSREVETIKEEKDTTVKQNESLIVRLDDNAAELDLVKTQLDVAVRENAEWKSQVDVAAMEISKLRNLVDSTGKENVSLTEQVKEMAKTSVEMTEEICQLNTALSNRGTDSEKRMKELEYESEELRTALEAAAHNLKRFENVDENVNVEELCSTNAELKERLSQMTYSVKASQLQMALVEEEWLTRLRKMTLENQQLKQKEVLLDANASKIEELENENILSLVERNKYEKLYSGAIARLDESTTMCETLSERNTRLEFEVKESESQLLKYQNRSRAVELKSVELKAVERKAVDESRATSSARAQDCSSLVEQRLRPIAHSVQLLREDKRAVERQVSSLKKKVDDDVQEIMAKVNSVVQNLTCINVDLVGKYRHEMALRKKLHDELVELKGNIRVFCRIRPVIKEDKVDASKRTSVVRDQDDNSTVVVDHKDRKLKFDCDRVFDHNSTQQEVFDEVKSLIVSCIDGFNVCIFAYGQTGSGKTYTMEGVAENPGLNQRALLELFEEIERRRPDWSFSVFVSVLEIYQETLRDLLSDGSSKVERLKVKMTAVGGLEVPGLTWAEVESVDDINEVSTIARQNRTTAMTRMNERSSRSHALLCVNVEGTNHVTGAKTIGKLNLVDLAGSERVHKSGAEGHRLKEAKCINRSLSSLGDVIHALRNKQPHIPYRNSKLTYLLQNSLGGNSKTLMIVQVAPVDDHLSETIASLTFAQRIRSIEMGQATKRTTAATRAGTSKERPL